MDPQLPLRQKVLENLVVYVLIISNVGMEVYNTWYGTCVVHGEGRSCGEVKGEISGCGGGMWNTVAVTHYQEKQNVTLARACNVEGETGAANPAQA